MEQQIEVFEPDGLDGQTVATEYKLTESQINYIKDSLKIYKSQTESFEDLIYGCPDKACPGFIITELSGRDDIVGMYYGHYENGKFYFYPVVDGLFMDPKLISGNVIGIIPFKDK